MKIMCRQGKGESPDDIDFVGVGVQVDVSFIDGVNLNKLKLELFNVFH